MDEILNKSIDQMPGMTFDCSCGRTHSVDISNIIIDNNILEKIPYILSPFRDKKIFLFSDSTTYKVFGSVIHDFFVNNNYEVKNFIFNTGEACLIPDEKALGRLIMELETDTSLIVAVGSGTLNDLARIVSSRTKTPYMIIGTAPSMDGYASVVSPLIIEGFKKTFAGVYAHSIIADIEIIKQAPMEMIHSGFGDVLGKMTALVDWKLSREINKEYYCPICVAMVQNAIDKCVSSIDGLAKRDDTAIKYLMEGLVYSGIAMGLAKDSRPASGAEHILAHYWEIDAISKGREHALHGNAVGVATVVVALIYKFIGDRLPVKIDVVSPEKIIDLLRKVGANYTPPSIGIDRDLLRKSILEGWKIRPRYTILRYAQQNDLLEELADKLDKYFYDSMPT